VHPGLLDDAHGPALDAEVRRLPLCPPQREPGQHERDAAPHPSSIDARTGRSAVIPRRVSGREFREALAQESRALLVALGGLREAPAAVADQDVHVTLLICTAICESLPGPTPGSTEDGAQAHVREVQSATSVAIERAVRSIP
jgi:hypothetical protein